MCEREQYRTFPQVLLLGNGLNRLVESSGWGDLLVQIKKNPKIYMDDQTVQIASLSPVGCASYRRPCGSSNQRKSKIILWSQ